MKRLPLHNLDQSGATDGQVPVWSDTDNAYVPADQSGGGGGGSRMMVPVGTLVDGEPFLMFTPDGSVLLTEVTR